MAQTAQVGRNEPCPCNSGKKYKRCCGVNAAPKLTPSPASLQPSDAALGSSPMVGAGPFGSGGFDPSQMDPQMMMQFSQALQRLPRGQMQRLQSLMQKAMAGKDISREAQEFERTLPPQFQEMMKSMIPSQGMPEVAHDVPIDALSVEAEVASTSGENANNEPLAPLDEEQARAIVAQAAAQGKISKEQATELLNQPAESAQPAPRGLGKLWKGFSGGK